MQNATSEPSGLWLRLGPMYSGKTLGLISQHAESTAEGRKIIAVKPRIDNRYADNEIVSHNGKRIPALSLESMSELNSEFDVLFVDEGQLLPGLVDFCRQLLLNHPRGKQIHVAALSGDASAEAWDIVSGLLALASKVQWHEANCQKCGNPASYSARFKPGPKTEVGGTDKFWPACTPCFFINLKELTTQ
jgi:thymidine kinase